MGKPILGITGVDGFIGTQLKNYLDKKGVITKSFYEGGNLKSFLKDVDILIHLAGRAQPPQEAIYEANVNFTNDLLKASSNFDIKKIIYLSTVAVYGNNNNPKDTYGKTKLQAENLIKKWGKKTNKTVQILRPFNVYGPGNKKGLVYEFYKSIKKDGTVTIYGDGSIKRDLLYINDLVKVLYLAIEKDQNFEIDVVNGKQYSLLEIINILKKMMKEDIKIIFEDEDPNKPKNIKINLTIAKKTLNWWADTSFEKGLRKTITWYETNLK